MDQQVGSCFALIALITGFFRARLFFLIAAITSGLSALLLMMWVLPLYLSIGKESHNANGMTSGAAIWTAVIAKSGWLKIVKVQGGSSLGIQINAGGTLCAFVFNQPTSDTYGKRRDGN